jgi:hypothetical protein
MTKQFDMSHVVGPHTTDKDVYDVGDVAYHNGTAILITGEPYSQFGGEWQDGTDATGKTRTVCTPRETRARIKANQDAWKAEQKRWKRHRC